MLERRPPRRVDYDRVAPDYDRRFAYYAGAREGVGAALVSLAREVRARDVLDIGCGTGHWLSVLAALGCRRYGLDLSGGMLKVAREAGVRDLVRASANALPLRPGTFDLVFCVSAIHHFPDPGPFIRDARSLLRAGGALAVIGMNPHAGRDRWYLYDYFPGTRQADLDRYPSAGAIADWMLEVGFDVVRCQEVERLRDSRTGKDILAEPMLEKNATSQLTLLTDEQYAAGVARIRADIARAESAGESLEFAVDISLQMVAGLVGVR